MEAGQAGVEAGAGQAAGSQEVAAAPGAAEHREAGDPMKMKHFIQRLDHDRIVAAIKTAEQSTSGQVRVFVSHRAVADSMKAARAAFVRMGIGNTPHRNGVLVFVAPEAQKFALLGDTAIHEKCGEELWQRIASMMSEHFKAGTFTDGIVSAIDALSAPLREHFPRSASDTNTLPDEVEEETK